MKPNWIAVDWGSTNLRAWAMYDNKLLGEAFSEEGIGKLSAKEFEPALLRLILPWLTEETIHVIACGMVGSRQGWQEAPYCAVPCRPVGKSTLVTLASTDHRILVKVTSGLKQNLPADVMRGEETQIAGALALYPDFEGVFCLPGTHSKWVKVKAGQVISFHTFMTGEIFSLLSTASVLRHSVAEKGWNNAAFDQGVKIALAKPQTISKQLFKIRSESLIGDLNADCARARLSGLLIGIEIAAIKSYLKNQSLAIIGTHHLTENYASAMDHLGLRYTRLDATQCTISGLYVAREAQQKEVK